MQYTLILVLITLHSTLAQNWGFCNRHDPNLNYDIHLIEPVDNTTTAFWQLVNFTPVPAFKINTHDPDNADHYVSQAIHDNLKPWNYHIWELFVSILSGRNGLVVDVGANIGYFSLLAASMGYDVIAFEPLTINVERFASSILENHFESQIQLYQHAVSSFSGIGVYVDGVSAIDQGNGIVHSGPAHPVDREGQPYGNDYGPTLSLDTIVKQDVVLLRIDVGGMEVAVLDGTRILLCNNTVYFITMDISTATKGNTLCPLPNAVTHLLDMGYILSDVLPNSESLNGTDEFPPNILFELNDTEVKRTWCENNII